MAGADRHWSCRSPDSEGLGRARKEVSIHGWAGATVTCRAESESLPGSESDWSEESDVGRWADPGRRRWPARGADGEPPT
jgi:hypothetical protein